jgi:AraC family ethanolamine operon transcriptional activator
LPPASAGFESIDALQKAASEAGWDLEYRQLEAGSLKAGTQLAELAGITLSLVKATHPLEVVGEPPAGALVVTIPCADSHLSVNGRNVGDDQMLVTTPGSELHFSTPSFVEVVTMHIPVSLFAVQADRLWPNWHSFAKPKAQIIRAGFETTESLRQRMYSSLRTRADASRAPELAGGLVAAFVSLLIGLEDESHAAVVSPSRGWWVLSRAREYIEEHLTEPITMADLCRVTGASLSSIEKVFRRTLSMAPTAYIRTCRLNAVRRVLVNDGSNGESISRIAADQGFTHLGRFSIAYREFFGMSPREEREAARTRSVRSSVG